MAVAAQFDRRARAQVRPGWFRLSVPVLVGIIDAASFLMYLFGISELPFYATVLSIKASLPMFARIDLGAARPALPLVVFMFLGIFVSTAANEVEPLAVYKSIAVLLSLMLTLVLIGRRLEEYALGVSLCAAAICVIYLAQIQRGTIGDHYGRFFFLGDSHPNLGGEILGIAVILAALCLGPWLYLALALTAGYCVWLMQSRSGLLAILVSVGLYGFSWLVKRYGLQRSLLLAVAGAFLFVIAVLAGVATGSGIATAISDVFWNTLFLADDEHRGASTGMSGRDHHWAEASRIFLAHPLFGAGLEYPVRLDVIQPHNWFLYAVAQFGIFGIPVILSLVVQLARGMIGSLSNALALAPIIPLLLINDRFLNFNIYPIAMYVLVFVLSRKNVRQWGEPA